MRFLMLAALLIVHAPLALAKEGIHWGASKALGNGTARTFVETGAKGEMLRIGFALSERALQGLPHAELELVLPLPAGLSAKPYEHLALNWNPHGHVPEHIYDVPHFDFHFYLITLAERNAIKCDAADTACLKQPLPEMIPEKYGPAPGGEPRMGWHWVDLLAPEFNGQKFGATFIYGYYNGLVNFIEPMITLDFLLAKPRFVGEVRRPQSFPRAGSYPQSYRALFDEKLKAYIVDMVM